MPILLCPRHSLAIFGWMPGRSFRRDRNRAARAFRATDRGLIDLLRRPNTVRPCLRAAGRDGLGAALIGPSSSHRIMAVKASQKTVEESMDSTVTPTPPKLPQDFTVAHFLDRIGRNPAEVDGDDAKGGQPDVAARQPGLVRFLIVVYIRLGPTLAWQWYGDAARAMIATSWPQLASLAPETASVLQAAPEQTAAAPQAMASPELQQLKEDLAQLKQELQQLKETPAALASLRQSVDRLAGEQQQNVATLAKL